MRYFILFLFAIYVFGGCSGSVDTTTLTPDDHFQYAMTLYADEDFEEALAEYQSILLQYPASPINDDAQFYLGMTYFKRDQFLLAAYEFSKLIRDIPTSPFLGDAQFMLANSYYELSPDFRLDPSYTSKAIEEFQAFIDFFPADERVDEAEKKISEMNYKLAEKSFNAGRIYEKMEYYNAAVDYYAKTVDTYHDTPFGQEAYYRKIKILLSKLRVEEAVRDMESFLNMYPDSEYAVEINTIYEEYSQYN